MLRSSPEILRIQISSSMHLKTLFVSCEEDVSDADNKDFFVNTILNGLCRKLDSFTAETNG